MIKNYGSAQLVVVLIVKEMSYLGVGLFDNLLGLFSYLCL